MTKYLMRVMSGSQLKALVVWKLFAWHKYKEFNRCMRIGMSPGAAFRRGEALVMKWGSK